MHTGKQSGPFFVSSFEPERRTLKIHHYHCSPSVPAVLLISDAQSLKASRDSLTHPVSPGETKFVLKIQLKKSRRPGLIRLNPKTRFTRIKQTSNDGLSMCHWN